MDITAQSMPEVAWARFDRRAANVLLVLAVFLFLLGLVVLAGAPGATIDPRWLEDSLGRPMVVGLALGAVTVNVVVLYAVSAGLNRGAAWARPAAVSCLVLLAVTGLAQVVVDLVFNGRLTVPIAALLALWALSTRPGWPAWPAGRDGAIAAALTLAVAAVLLLSIVPWRVLGG